MYMNRSLEEMSMENAAGVGNRQILSTKFQSTLHQHGCVLRRMKITVSSIKRSYAYNCVSNQ
jgi:hypothetical protein